MTTRSELKRLAEALISANESYLADGCNIEKQNAFHDADDALQDALPPEEVLALIAEIERLQGIQPEYPPRPPEGEGLPRYGLRWNGPQQPLAVPMDDGYWAPWHLAHQLNVKNEALRQVLDSCAVELAAETICKHGGQNIEDMHPVTRRLYERDMAPVIEARAVLAKGVRP